MILFSIVNIQYTIALGKRKSTLQPRSYSYNVTPSKSLTLAYEPYNMLCELYFILNFD